MKKAVPKGDGSFFWKQKTVGGKADRFIIPFYRNKLKGSHFGGCLFLSARFCSV